MRYYLFLVALTCGLILSAQKNEQIVSITSNQLTLPTYLVGPDGKNPIFYFGKAYQGAQGRMYPYASKDLLTDEKVEKTYKALNLENEFLKIEIIPEFGGKLFTAQDKTNNHDFIYKQTVVKPLLIGMLGAWIAGGVEWNVLHHHRVTTFTPVDYAMEKNEDGSATVWVGEIDLRHRMKWSVGVTVYPNRSYFESTMIAYNRSPFIHSMLYFANAGVHSTEDYQVIFPPSTEWVTQHAKREYAKWPIAHEIYNGVDFSALGKELGTNGTDISWWKNNIKQISFFAYNYEDDWMAGYDHGKKAGICIVADHHIAPGKKFWTTGSGERGKVWDAILTDNDGPEMELMAGGYSDNEPDYSWMQPGETKIVKHYFYPLREMMGGVKNANKDAAVNLEISEGFASVAFNTTSTYDQALVKIDLDSKILFEERIKISPDNPYNHKIVIPQNINIDDLQVSLISKNGHVIISYRPEKSSAGAFPGYAYRSDSTENIPTPMPDPVKQPLHPSEIESNEMLYLTGMRLEQFYHPTLDPEAFYEEGLRRDPGDQRINTALGILMLRQGKYAEAKEHLQNAVQRASWNYTHPRDAEAFYYLGLTHKKLGSLKEAYDALYQSTWDAKFHTSGHYLMAEIRSIQKDYHSAIDHLNASLSTNVNHLKAKALKAALLRKSGNLEEAITTADASAQLDLLDHWSLNELYLAQVAIGMKDQADQTKNRLRELMRDEANSCLELATDYGNCGLWDEAIDIIDRLIDIEVPGKSDHPLLYYYKAFCHEQLDDAANADKYYSLASRLPADYVFPFRLEMIPVLESVIRRNPQDFNAPYYLGNLLFELQPERAVKEWENARARGSNLPTLYRNLGLAYDRVYNDLEKAVASYRQAVELNPFDSKVIYEQDNLLRVAQADPSVRLKTLQKYHNNVVASGYYPALQNEVQLYTLLGEYDKAIDLAGKYHYRRWEGGKNVYTSYVDSYLLRGKRFMERKQFKQALQDFIEAGKFPLSMEAAKDFAGGRTTQVQCFLGDLYLAMGDENGAEQAFKAAISERLYDNLSTPWYYRAYALEKLGRSEEARKIFQRFVMDGTRRLKEIDSSTGISFFAKFGDRLTDSDRKARAFYQIGLGSLGMDKKNEAKKAFEQAASLDVNHLWSRIQLAEMASMD